MTQEGKGTSAGLERARSLLARSRKVVVLTGAGMSAESGVPTFRGDEGLWKRYRPEELATPEAFRRDPRLVWEWYAWRRERVAACTPHAGHRAVAGLQLREGIQVRVVTQNVDGLHERALLDLGTRVGEGHRPIELHGSLFRIRCTGCPHGEPHRAPIDASSVERLPRCPRCGALLRPAVVWFGEGLEDGVLAAAFRAVREAELCLVVGTSARVQPAASLPLDTLRSGGTVVEVNPEATPLSRIAAVSLRGGAATLLPLLLG